jgi:hypothetical protein
MPEERTPAQTERTQPERRSWNEATVEVWGDLCRNAMFPPTQERVRGRWDPHEMPPGDVSSVGLLQMPVIPGMYVRVNVREKKAAVVDPLSFPENRALLDKVSESHHSLFQKRVTSVDPVVRENMNDDDLASWVYWMMRLVQGGSARLIKGELPATEDEVQKAFPRGKIRKDYFNTLAAVERLQGQQAATP